MANYKMVIEDNAGNGYLPAPGLPTKTAAQWSAENRVLLFGEMVQESDTGLIKTGDGVKSYTSLPYFNISEGQIKSGFAQSLAASGYKKLPGGLIIQWGRVTTTKVSAYVLQAVFNFPILFSSTPILTASAVKDTNSYIECVSTQGLGTATTTYGVAKVMNKDGGFNSESYVINWLAVGF